MGWRARLETGVFPAKMLPMTQKTLIILGTVLVLAGLLWPWLSKIGLGRLPGDIVIRQDNFQFYLPVTTSILISLLLSLLFWWFRK